ncbi:sigma-70 family RNA polymerase sigma factor [Shewanella fidelis]|uniref:Sigma-70 family RNA polymerase sigma factor n=1 Tax=Shewanella fidelis TaxID=173509 RepID=A0AAW8NQX5_9GAMM|nr:sigma-70 family RNA polymerase sigma factor [Shewanella fidelis]MDR8524606.1 sigma-70 family RNA polymerase sigma factor [Shewanella fidelis]MDW4812081.1 sigma-70 family RNA polymerase sigma factor [Shewanella fidelis]MDW4817464.1 sigma-70 family RNA polymerase sigma factor [Shewanella fidelis]MDW4821531.1 sigma-70 family RNA polymerase sigma factor [Shewanella fidelis]MDW4822688.1 sigma-70 family RNA polymerase sigma factor [Shewanella fidelis]
MLQYAAGNARAFEVLYLKHKGPLYRYFVRQLNDQQLAEDLYQDTWSRVIKAASSYETSAKFTTWLYRIAHNLIIDHLRAVKPVNSFTEVFEPEQDHQAQLANQDDNLESQLMDNQKATLLKGCVADLPQVQKEAFLLNVEMGFTAAIIADIAGATLEATKSRIRYAYKGLKDCVELKWQGANHD